MTICDFDKIPKMEIVVVQDGFDENQREVKNSHFGGTKNWFHAHL